MDDSLYASADSLLRRGLVFALLLTLAVTGCGQVPTPVPPWPGEFLYRDLAGYTISIQIDSGPGARVGTGFFLGNTTTHVLTCAHLIEHASSLSGRSADGPDFVPLRVLARDPIHDLALLEFTEEEEQTGRRLPRLYGKRPSLGEPIIAIGNSAGHEFSAMSGIVSRLRRELSVGGLNLSFVQLNAIMHPGASGSPVLSLDGRLIGLASRKDQAEGIILAVPAEDIAAFLERVIPGQALIVR
jgi:S1-C subfamily serine protease